MTRCPACAEMVPEGAHFCPSCGHTLVAATHEERRIVTVLFADLVGFTELAEFMDPEQAKRLVDRCFARLVDDITSFGGRIDKILGDGILALFGAPVAHEDDPERAVRAGLQMQKSLSASEEAGGNGEARIQMRVGINTGEVLVGVLAGGDYTAMGDVVNTAARLQGLGPPGRVIVGESTYALTAHAFDYEPFGSLVAKGRAQKVPAWLAVAATGPPGVRRRHRLDVPMVGRLDELSIGGHALQMAIHRSTAVVLSITGESGVGKRRLVDELLGQTGDDAFVLETECLPYGEANVYRPIATALAKHFGFDLSGPIDAIRSQLRTPPDSAVIHFDEIEFAKLMEVFIHLHGHPSDIDHLDPASTRSTIHWAITKAFERTATRRPTVLTIDNLHWADPLLIELLEHLVHALSRLPFVLVTAMRPLNELLWPPRSDRVSVFSLVLQPLSHAETDELARRLLSEVAHDDQLLAGLYDRSGGNPLFLQELAALTGDGLSADGLSSAGLPSTLRTLIGARLDQLTGPQRQVIDNAATLGTSGSTLSLQQFAAATGQVFDPASLRELDNAGLLQVDGHHWEFRSDSVRDAAYQTLTKASRAIRHSGVANAIRANTTALNTTTLNTTTLNTTAAIDQLAHHLATAAELERELGPVVGVPATIVDDAIEALLAASTKALETGALRATVRHTTRALGLLASTTGNNATVDRLRLMRANALVDQRLEDEAQADIDAVLVSAETSGDRATEGEARRLLGNLHQAEGRLDMARTELGRAVDILRTADRPDLLAHALRSRGFIELFGGSLVDSEWYLGEADAIFRELGDRRGMAWVEQHRAWILFLGGDQRAAHERLQHSAKTLEELGDRNGVTWVLGLLGFVEFFLRNFDAARTLAVQVGSEAEERGDTWAAAMMQTLQANLYLWQGDLEEAAALAETARSRFRRLADRYGLSQAMAPLLRAQTGLGWTAAAQRTEEELFAVADTAAASVGALPLLAVAGAQMHRGDGLAAASSATRTIAELRGAGSTSYEPMIILAMAQGQIRRVDEALATLESIPPENRDHPFANAVTAIIEALAGHPVAALAASAQVTAAGGASYLDQVLALVGAAGAHHATGDGNAALAAARAAVDLALRTGDVPATALASNCLAAVNGRKQPAVDSQHSSNDGWAAVIAGLFPA